MPRHTCIVCCCPLEADEPWSCCQDCHPIYSMGAGHKERQPAEALVRRLHYLRQRAAAGLPLFEERGQDAISDRGSL